MKNSPINFETVEIIMDVFKTKYNGKKNAAKTKDVICNIKTTGRGNISPQTFRDFLGYIRENDLMNPCFIVSDVNTGYWLTEDLTEQQAFLNQQLNRMANQFGNLKLLHIKLSGKNKKKEYQPSLFQ